MLQPVNAATPLIVGSGLALEQFRVAPAAVVIVNATELVSLTTTLPPRSSTLTTGWTENAVFVVELFGDVVNASFAAVPTVIPKLLLVAENDPSTACRV